MNDLASETTARPNWTARILGLVQHLVEITVLGEVLIAVGMIFHPFPVENKPGIAGMEVRPIMLVAGILTAVPLAWLACQNFWTKLAAAAHQGGFRRLWPMLLSLTALVIIVSGLCLLPRWSPTLLQAQARVWPREAPIWEPGAWVSLMALVILARTCRRPWIFYLASLSLFALAYGGLFWYYVLPKIHYIRRNFNIGLPYPGQALLQPGFMVSMLFMPLRTVLGVLIPFLAALYCIRRGFTWWKYLAGGLAGWLLTHGILDLRWPDLASRLTWLGLILTGVFLFLMARLPGQRWSLERLTGLSFATQPELAPAPPRGGWAASLLAHGLFGILIALLAFFSVVGFYEGKILRDLPAGPAIQPCSPALVNAYTILKPIYEDSSIPEGVSDELVLLKDLSPMPRAKLEEVKGLIDPALAEKEIQAWNPKFALLVQASGADCYRRLELNRFVGFASFLRGFMARATWRILQGQRAEALGDIEALLRLAWMMNTDPNATVVQHLLAVLMRGIALDGAQNYFLYFRQDPAALKELQAMLNRNARLVRIDFPAESFAHQSAFQPVVPYFEMVVPLLAGRGEAFYQRWEQFDALLLGTALEAYRHDHGAYPGRLEDLTPGCLECLPREPFQGQAYRYENLGQDFRLYVPRLANPRNPDQNGFPGIPDAWASRNEQAIRQFKSSRHLSERSSAR